MGDREKKNNIPDVNWLKVKYNIGKNFFVKIILGYYFV